jgi:hypothetical protein
VPEPHDLVSDRPGPVQDRPTQLVGGRAAISQDPRARRCPIAGALGTQMSYGARTASTEARPGRIEARLELREHR